MNSSDKPVYIDELDKLFNDSELHEWLVDFIDINYSKPDDKKFRLILENKNMKVIQLISHTSKSYYFYRELRRGPDFQSIGDRGFDINDEHYIIESKKDRFRLISKKDNVLLIDMNYNDMYVEVVMSIINNGDFSDDKLFNWLLEMTDSRKYTLIKKTAKVRIYSPLTAKAKAYYFNNKMEIIRSDSELYIIDSNTDRFRLLCKNKTSNRNRMKLLNDFAIRFPHDDDNILPATLNIYDSYDDKHSLSEFRKQINDIELNTWLDELINKLKTT